MPLNVYFLDDEKEICENFKDSFESETILITTFFDPNLAMAAIAENPPDILFLDFRLPGTSGEEIAQKTPANIIKCLITGEIFPSVGYPFFKIISKPFNDRDIQEVLKLARAKLGR